MPSFNLYKMFFDRKKKARKKKKKKRSKGDEYTRPPVKLTDKHPVGRAINRRKKALKDIPY